MEKIKYRKINQKRGCSAVLQTHGLFHALHKNTWNLIADIIIKFAFLCRSSAFNFLCMYTALQTVTYIRVGAYYCSRTFTVLYTAMQGQLE
jgi:hypothetical protein